MRRAARIVRTTTVSALTAAGLVGGSQLAVGTLAAARQAPMSTTTAVNVRSGPSLSARVLAVAWSGSRVRATGMSRHGWTPVSWKGRTAWISSAYLVSSMAPVPVAEVRAASTAVTTDALNVRTGPSTSTRVVTVLDQGTTVSLTGTTSGSWLQITWGRRTRWVSGAYVSSAGGSSSSTPAVTGRARATTDLMIRTNPGPSSTDLGDIPEGTILPLTGKTSRGVSQVVWQGRLRWVNSLYLAKVSGSTQVTGGSAPKTAGHRYAVTALTIRTSPTGDGTLFEVPSGTKLAITGVKSNGRAQVVYQGAVRWVTAAYLSTTPPDSVSAASPVSRTLVSSRTLDTGGSEGLDALTSNAKWIVHTVRGTFPQISTMYGVRADPLPDHPSGHAVDIMLPHYGTNYALGLRIAHYMQAHASELNIQYVIYHQHIWSVARSSEGWRLMADRGGDTANHFDHVHVTVN